MDSLTLLALNLLKKNREVIHSLDIVPPPDSCPICFEDILQTNQLQPYVILTCDHIFHYKCIEKHQKTYKDCPLCRKKIFDTNDNSATSSREQEAESNLSYNEDNYEPDAIIDIQNSPVDEYDDADYDPTYNEGSSSTRRSSRKLPKKRQKRNNKSKAERIVEEVTSDLQDFTLEGPSAVVNDDMFSESNPDENSSSLDITSYEDNNEDSGSLGNLSIDENGNNIVAGSGQIGVFTTLIQKVINSEEHADRKNQEAILCNYRFGEAMEKRYEEIKEHDNCSKHIARTSLNEEIRNQLPIPMPKVRFRKMKERANKIYVLFKSIGEDKINKIRSFSANSISKLTVKEIQEIIYKVNVDEFEHQIQLLNAQTE